MQDFNSDINKKRNVYTLRGICNERNIEYYTLEGHDFKNIDSNNARDGKHNGPLMQKAIAEEFINLLDKQYYEIKRSYNRIVPTL